MILLVIPIILLALVILGLAVFATSLYMEKREKKTLGKPVTNPYSA